MSLCFALCIPLIRQSFISNTNECQSPLYCFSLADILLVCSSLLVASSILFLSILSSQSPSPTHTNPTNADKRTTAAPAASASSASTATPAPPASTKMQHITMTTIAHPPSKVGPSTHHKHHLHTPSSPSAPPPPPPPPPPPARIVRCGICMDDFEWFSLKALNGYQEDPKDNSATTITTSSSSSSSSSLSRICQRRFHIFCSHSRNQGSTRAATTTSTTTSRQGRSRWTSNLFGGESRRQRREQKLKQVAATGPSVEALKLGCSLHTGKDHAFCLECLARYVDTQVKAQAWPIVCPHENCREVVSSFAVETLLGSEALQWHRLAVDHAIQKKIYCPSNACGRLIDGDRNDEEEAVDRHCPYCNKPFCAMCHGEAHEGINCQQRLDKIFQTMAADSKWKSCPSCKHMIEKESGCDHMTCRCGNQFCYVCGGNGWPCRNRH